MLEQQSLLLLPWQTGPDARAWIVEPGSSAPLGFVRRRRSSGPLSWLCWWRRSILAVHEYEDEPLLLTLHARLASWLVRDADGHLVGRVRGQRLLDGFGYPLAHLQASPDGASYRNRDQHELAVTAREDDGVRLTFLLPEDGNPFVKMVLLAAALVHNQDVLASSSGANSPCSPASPSLPTGTS